jgi:hypothetical protein
VKRLKSYDIAGKQRPVTTTSTNRSGEMNWAVNVFDESYAVLRLELFSMLVRLGRRKTE